MIDRGAGRQANEQIGRQACRQAVIAIPAEPLGVKCSSRTSPPEGPGRVQDVPVLPRHLVQYSTVQYSTVQFCICITQLEIEWSENIG